MFTVLLLGNIEFKDTIYGFQEFSKWNNK